MAMSTNQGGGVFSEINITPLTDIFLVLLIILTVNLVADAVSRKLDPRVGWTSRRDR